jgi:hypothetical protein
MRVYNEKSGAEFEAWFESLPGVATVPVSAHWKLENKTAKKVMQDWTEVAVEIQSDETGITGVKIDVEIDGALNTRQTATSREQMRLWVVAAKDTPREYSQSFDYYIAKGRG